MQSTLSTTVTLMFTDIEGSTANWEHQPESMADALRTHDDIMRRAADAHGGHVFKTVGDAFCVAFHTAQSAVLSALQAQSELAQQTWPNGLELRVRMALHSGAVEQRDSDYFGPPLNRVARLLASVHGGQVVATQATYELARELDCQHCKFTDLGLHRLKDLARPGQVYQVDPPDVVAAFPPLRSLSHHPNNLPQQVSSFIGRERDLVELAAFVRKHRIVTLTGTGGTGKTRLSLQVAADALDEFSDGAYFVELAPLASHDHVPIAIAEALRVRDEAGEPLRRIVNELRDRRVLLVLDNCEHLLEACSQVCTEILTQCPKVVILASSREALRIPGEQTYRVPPLSLPPKDCTGVTGLSQFEAVRLFIDRAVLYRSDFAVTNDNAPAVASLCVRLDGIPLAIELAAARVRSLPVQEIDRRLDQRFNILTGGLRTALPRQQTLRALIDWSVNLLDPKERTILLHLGVFAGSWSIEEAEAICSVSDGHSDPIESWEVLDLLTSLTDKSLCIADWDADRPRYRLLESIREYALDALASQGLLHARRDLHLRYYLSMCEELGPKLQGPDQANAIREINAIMDNVREALNWSLSTGTPDPERSALGLRMVMAISRSYLIRGQLHEGAEACQRVLDQNPPDQFLPERSRLLGALGLFAWHRSDYAAAEAHCRSALSIREQIGDDEGIASINNNLANILFVRGDYAQAFSIYKAVHDRFLAQGDRSGVALSLNNMACSCCELGDLEQAEQLAIEGLELRRQVGDHWNTAYSLLCLTTIYAAGGNWERACSFAKEALDVRRTIDDRPGIAESLVQLAGITLRLRQQEPSQRHLIEAIPLLLEQENRMDLARAVKHVAYLRRVADPETAIQLWQAASRTVQETGCVIAPSERGLDEFERDAVLAAARPTVEEPGLSITQAAAAALQLLQGSA